MERDEAAEARKHEDAIRFHVQRATERPKSSDRTDRGPVSAKNLELIRAQTGLDLAGFRRVIESSDIRHVFRSRGDPARETARGQLPVPKADLVLIPRIIECAKAVRLIGLAGAAKPRRLEYDAQLSGIHYRYVEEIRASAAILALKTMRKWQGENR